MSTDIESIIKADFVGFHTVHYLCLFRHRLSSSFLMHVYLSKSVPLTFPVTQVAILTHLWHILPHKGSIKRSQLPLWQEPIQFQSASDFTIYLCCLRYLLLSCPDHNSITFLVVVEVTCASLTSRHIFLGKLRCELSSGDSLSLHQAFSAACGSFSLYPPLLQVKHGQKFC